MFVQNSLSSIRKAKNIICKKPTTMYMNPFPGLDIGIPLSIFENVYTHLHYGENIITYKNIALEFLMGYYVYGTDRYNDALDYNNNKFITTKKDLYDYINENRLRMDISLDIAHIGIYLLMLSESQFYLNLPFLFLLETTKYYKQTKPYLGVLKPIYISMMWTIAAIIIPCVMYEHNYNIFFYPQDYLPCTLTLFAASNIVDNKDVMEDINNNITTIPVVLGEERSNMLSMVALICSSLLLGFNKHYLDQPIFNSLMEIQNAGISFLPFALNGTL